MDELSTEVYGFDFRGPASSEVLNEFAENLQQDLTSLLAASLTLKADFELLSSQTLKQTYAISKKLKEVQDRDDGSTCLADLTDSTVLSYVDHNDDTIATANRIEHLQQYGILVPPYYKLDRLSFSDGEKNYISDGVTVALESVNESGTLYNVPAELAIAGYSSIFYERLIACTSIPALQQEFSYMFSVPPSRTGSGYSKNNYLSFIPFPIYTPSMRVYYTTDWSPTLTIAGDNWSDWDSYVDSLYHNDVYTTKMGPVFASFPEAEITAIRIDIKQPYYIVEDTNYIFSSGLGQLSFGLIRPTATTAQAVIRIDKPTGNFVSIEDTHVTFDNIDSGELDDLYETYSWIDADDATVAYVEITLSPETLSGRQLPIIKEVSIDYL